MGHLVRRELYRTGRLTLGDVVSEVEAGVIVDEATWYAAQAPSADTIVAASKGAGAKLIQQWQDVAAELPPQIAAKILPPPLSDERKKEKSLADRLLLVPQGLTGFEQSVFKLLSADNPAHIDALVDQSRLGISDLTAALLTLEMRDLVRALPGKCFVRKM